MPRIGYTWGMEVVILVGGLVSLLAMLAWIGLLLWAAREDGRDQRRRDAERPRDPGR